MPMISTTIFQPPTNGLLTIKVNACFNCGGDHGFNYCKEPCDQNLNAQNKAKFEEERYLLQVEVTLVEDVLVAVSIIRAKAITNEISLELPILPVKIGLSVLMEFGWLFVASIRPRVLLPMHKLLVFMMLLF